LRIITLRLAPLSESGKFLSMTRFLPIFLVGILVILAVYSTSGAARRSEGRAKRYEALTGYLAKESNDKVDWDKKFSKSEYIFGKSPATFLAKNYKFIRPKSKILDMGMGEGRNAVFLATKGHEVTGIDISSVAVRKAKLLAREYGVRINALSSDLSKYEFEANSFDAIIVYYYVDRELNKKIQSWLKPGGILIYEAHTMNQRKIKGYEHHNKNYLLKPGELLSMFPNMRVLKYEEPLHAKNEFRASGIFKN
jgi:tellurite methyltransferase